MEIAVGIAFILGGIVAFGAWRKLLGLAWSAQAYGWFVASLLLPPLAMAFAIQCWRDNECRSQFGVYVCGVALSGIALLICWAIGGHMFR